MHSTKDYKLIALLTAVAFLANVQMSTSEFRLSITQNRFSYIYGCKPNLEETTKRILKDADSNICMTKFNKIGKCVPWRNCNNEHEIEYGGIIKDAHLRTLTVCGDGEWCCSEKNDISSRTAASTTAAAEKVSSCYASSDVNYCPWCVKLYRSGKDPFKRPSGLFCLGALVGPQTIVTAASCTLQAQNDVLWVRVPNSANPNTNYTIQRRLRHPNYNSGTRANDIAVLSTQREIEWGESTSISGGGACIDPDSSVLGECLAANVDDSENIVLTNIVATRGSCFAGGNVTDAACGHGLLLDMLLQGAPTMCPKNNQYILTGLTKLVYHFDPAVALIGNLDYSWLTTTLRDEMGLSDKDFLFSPY